jgi:hypothetical protein
LAATNNDHLFVLNAADVPVVRLSNNASSDAGARISPDGSKIAYVNVKTNQVELKDFHGKLLGTFNFARSHKHPADYLRDYEITDVRWLGNDIVSAFNYSSPDSGILWAAGLAKAGSAIRPTQLFENIAEAGCHMLPAGTKSACVSPTGGAYLQTADDKVVKLFREGEPNGATYDSETALNPAGTAFAFVRHEPTADYLLTLNGNGDTFSSAKQWKLALPKGAGIRALLYLDAHTLRIQLDSNDSQYADVATASLSPDSTVVFKPLPNDDTDSLMVTVSKTGLGLNAGDSLTVYDSTCMRFGRALVARRR